MRFKWGEFFKIAGAFIFIGSGVAVVGNSEGNLIQMIIGFALGAIGIAILAATY